MNRDKRGRFSRKGKWFMILVVILVVSGYITYSYNVKKNTVEFQAPVVKVLEGIDAIANRPDIKRQQELIVKEAYVKEEKQKTLEEKKKTVAEFDQKLSGYETELEAIRKEKTTF